MMDSIEITKNNIEEIKYNNIMFLSFAEAGAMGEPGGIKILLKDSKLYHTNYCYNKDIKIEDLFSIFPPLATFQCGMCIVTNLDKNWKWIDMGMGNYLLIRNKIHSKYMEYLEKEIENDKFRQGKIYAKWLEIARKMLVENMDKYMFLSVHYEDDEISNRTYYYISDIEDINENDMVLVDRNGYEAIGTVAKIEIFNKLETPFPVEKTKHIIRKVDKDYQIEDWHKEYKQEIESYEKLFLNTMFNRLSIKRLINLMFIEKSGRNIELNDKLYYMPRMNLFFYKDGNRYRIAETPKHILSDEIFRILERESIEVPRKIIENVYTANNYKEAILFCRENYLIIHDDTDILDFTEQKRELYKKEENKITENKFKKIEDIIEYLKKYKGATYKYPSPDYYIADNQIIHYLGWINYDRGIFDLYEFLENKKYINKEKAFQDFEKYNKEWVNWEKWNIDDINYEKANYIIVRLYNRERVCEGLINNYAESGKLLNIIEKLINN